MNFAYSSHHQKQKRNCLSLSLIELIFVASNVIFILVQFVGIGITFSRTSNTTTTTEISTSHDVHSTSDESQASSALHVMNVTSSWAENINEATTDHHDFLEFSHENVSESELPPVANEVDVKNLSSKIFGYDICINDDGEYVSCDDGETVPGEEFYYRTVIGARISLSIQLIIYLSQLGFAILLIIAVYHNDSRNLNLWILFSEIMVVIVCLHLLINFFGKFVWWTAAITGVYCVFKIYLIRLVARFKRVNDLELTQFGSVTNFDY